MILISACLPQVECYLNTLPLLRQHLFSYSFYQLCVFVLDPQYRFVFYCLFAWVDLEPLAVVARFPEFRGRHPIIFFKAADKVLLTAEFREAADNSHKHMNVVYI